MTTTDDLLYPRSRFEVLRTLFLSSEPVPLREISYRSELMVGSVQTVLRKLVDEKIVRARKVKGRPYYELADTRWRGILAPLIAALTNCQLALSATEYQRRAFSMLTRLDERRHIIQHAKRSIAR